jgi:peptide/nickel transport system substrate-binding protein
MTGTRSAWRPARRLVACLAAALAAAALTVVSPGTATAATGTGTDYRIGDTQPIDSVNPFNEQNEISYDITSLSYDLLLNYKTGDLQPDLNNSLAQSYTVSPDGLTWTFTLRSGITWSDGVPFTSADVVWTYTAVHDNTTNVMNAYLAGMKSVEAPDPTTVVLHLSSPDVRMASIFVPILPKHVFDKYPVKKLDKIALPLPSVTTAPFQITSYDKNGTTVLSANPRFRGKQPAMKRVLITYYGNPDSELRDLQGGNLDMVVDGNTRWTTVLQGNKSVRQWSGVAAGFDEIAFNSCPPAGAGGCSGPGKDVHVKVVQDHAIRQALAYGIDRSNIAQTVYAGQNLPAYGIISPYYSDYYHDWSNDPTIGYRFDQAKAKQVLADGGWNCSAHPCTKDGAAAAFTLYVRTDDEPGQNAMRRVAAWADQLGIKITLSFVSEDALNNKIYAPGKNNKYAPDYDAFYWAWTGDPTPDFNFSVLNTGSAWSDSYYTNATYDSLTAKALQERDFPQRVSLLHDAEKIAMTDLPYIPIVYANSYDLTRTDTWHNYQPSPAGKNGSPISANWLQLTDLQPGPEPAAASPGAGGSHVASAKAGSGSGNTAIWVTVIVAVAVAALGFVLGRSRRRRRGGNDWDEDADDVPGT